MKSLLRDQIDALVREVEADAYGFALALQPLPASAERVVVEAFTNEARAFVTSPSITDLKEKLRVRIRARSPRRPHDAAAHNPVRVPAGLHSHLVDCVEEQQYVEPTGRRKAVLIGVIVVGVALSLIGVAWVRWQALSSSQPTIAEAFPAVGGVEVPIRGEVKISFGHRPSGPPRVRLDPAGGTLGPTAWDGKTLVVSYEGLRNATRYQLILEANYESRFKDRGHLKTRWSFTTERYPVLVSVAPSNGAEVIARNGQLAIEFNHRPAVDPRVSLVPADGTIDGGSWKGATWTVAYAGLEPLKGYQATVVVDYGVASANIQQSWTFTTEPAIPPAGTPVLWHSGTDPANHAGVQRTIALDWDGNIVGTTYQPVTLQSADGSIVGTSDGTYVDRNGKPLGVLSGIPYYPVIADDSASVCELSSTVGGRTMDQLWLQTGPLTGPLRAVTPVGNFAGSAGIGIIACSSVNDRAVVGYSGVGGTSAVKVIALSTGRVVYQHTYVLAVSNIVSSHDARYLAEQMPVAGSMGAPSMTMIRRTSDGAIVARLDNQLAVRFSWDDRRLVTTTPYQGGTTNQVTLIEWPTNRVLWKLPAPPNQGQPFFAWAQPNGTKMAIAGSSQAAWPLDMLWVVDADGQAKQVLSESFYPASVIGF